MNWYEEEKTGNSVSIRLLHFSLDPFILFFSFSLFNLTNWYKLFMAFWPREMLANPVGSPGFNAQLSEISKENFRRRVFLLKKGFFLRPVSKSFWRYCNVIDCYLGVTRLYWFYCWRVGLYISKYNYFQWYFLRYGLMILPLSSGGEFFFVCLSL